MAFQDDLRRYLERLLSEGPDAPRSWFSPDLRLHRRHLLQELERLEATGTSRRGPHGIESIHRFWSRRVDSFATQMGALLVNGLAHGAPPHEITQLVNIALSRQLGVETSTGSFVRDTELDRLSSELDSSADRGDERDVPQYALEIRAVRRGGDRRHLTPIGRIALDLPERDILRWLLTAEVMQSRGPSDAWRLSRSAAAKLRKRPHRSRAFDDDAADNQWLPAAWTTMVRLANMGMLTFRDVDDEETGEPLGRAYEVAPAAFPLLEELASTQDTPFSVLIAAILSDETTATLDPLRPPPTRQAAASAATATTRHARMVAHEIRNALVPVQGALDALYRDAARHGSKSLVEGHRDAIDGGIERVFSFIKDMMEVAERGAEPPDAFGIAAAIQDAISAVSSELGGNVGFEPVPALPPVIGHRHRFTLAVVNLVRNALQAGTANPITVRVTAKLGDVGTEVLVIVEDNGPGVPVEHRSTIFEQGFSLRPGGTGLGLALVREVVESEMGGRATCEDSPLGGARFLLKLPVPGKTAG